MILDCKIFSFDIFDTTLTRCVAKPKDIFLLMQRKIVEEKIDVPKELVNNFYSIRLKAEIKARLKKYVHKRREIVIEDIYEQIRLEFRLDLNQIKKLIDLECDVEYRSIYPIAWTLSKINLLRQKEKRIIFVSDMYLPLSLIKDMLIKIGVYKDSDTIYLSSDIGLQKFTGSLFRYILKQEQCLSKQMCHFGDNAHSDVFMPSLLGISIDPCPNHITSN